MITQLAWFAGVGTIFTGVDAGLYVLLYGDLGSFWANIVAIVVSTIADTAAQRRFTFGVRGRRNAVRHQAQGLLLLVAGIGITSGALWLLHTTDPTAGRLAEVVALGLANLVVGLGRFTAFRFWVFATRTSDVPAHASDARTSGRDGQDDPVTCSLPS